MRVGSLFSGIGGFDLGLERAGFEVVFQCDNDPFCNKVLAHHWPGVKRYDDVRSIGLGPAQRDQQGEPYDGKAGEPDAARAGHVGAGLREPTSEEWARSTIADSAATQGAVGRDGQGRGGAVDLICGGFPCQDLSVAGKRAGLDGGRSGLWFEFKRILSELRPGWAIIENVPGLLSSNQGRDFAVVLDGLGECGFAGISWAVLDSQHFGVAQRRRRVYVVAGPSRRCVETVLSLCEGCGGYPAPRRTPGEDVADPTGYGVANSLLDKTGRLQVEEMFVANISPTLRAGGNHTGGDRPPGTDVDTVETLLAHSHRADGFDASEDGTGRGTPIVSVRTAQTSSNGWGIDESETAYTLDRADGQAIGQGASVRRLTPTECERLQGFPDGWTDVGGAADGPRYKALGNAVSVPVIEYLGLRIMAVM